MFHLWVMAGSFAHFWFMLTAVVPFACAAGPAPAWQPVRPRPTPPPLRSGFSFMPRRWVT
jgi:hypothetical protein